MLRALVFMVGLIAAASKPTDFSIAASSHGNTKSSWSRGASQTTAVQHTIRKHCQVRQGLKCDLSGLVSKYVGETVKNLKPVFGAAETSGAVLHFDEGDALFGRRSRRSRGVCATCRMP